MPADSKPTINLVCPTCGRDLMNFAPAGDGRTVAYCVCNNRGPVLEYTTSTPPAEYLKKPPAPPAQEKSK